MTFLLETMRLGLSNLRLHLLRSVLTALGIILGVGAVITMVAIGEGSKQEALRQIERLGAKNIILRSQRPPETGTQQGGQQRSFVITYGLTRGDLAVIRESFPDAEVIAPLKEVGGQVLRGNRVQTSQSFGVTPELMDAAGIKVDRGRYITQNDLDERSTIAVIGSEVARQLFAREDPLGETIRIDDKPFLVVGVMAPVGLSGGAGASLVGRDLNLDVHVPFTTATQVFGDVVLRRQSGSFSGAEVQISEIYIVCKSRDRVLTDAERIKRIMAVRHPTENDVASIVPYELLEEAKRTAMTWQIVLGAIAGISLLVGGIGIMNIMLATVQERTREIGIRRAVGATRRHITAQFVVETGVLSAIGGLLGVIFGVGLSVGMDALGPHLKSIFKLQSVISANVTGWSVGLAFTVAVLTGLFFGIFPAIKAARQDPIVALRHD
ncbi:MAG TPA: ABC transporter permease [Phycisphaerales bacterium]|nr:ABC transporter permease [Phycisphaerales bacterium]